MATEMNLWTRLTTESPKFFKRVIVIALTLAGAAGAVLALPITLPAAVTTALGYLVTAGLVASAVAKATMVDNTSTTTTATP